MMPIPLGRKKDGSGGKITLIDIPSLREATEVFAAGDERPQIDFNALAAILARIRVDWQWAPTDQLPVAVASLDPNSEGQQRFAEALKRYFIVDASHYRDNFVSTPPGRHPSEFFDKEKGLRPVVSVASRLAYTLGRMAVHAAPEILVVSHSFELHYPLSHLAKKHPGKVGLAYFASVLDHRWKFVGLGDSDCPIWFYDLGADARALLGGSELRDARSTQTTKPEGLDLLS
jgi:hypothetical protein